MFSNLIITKSWIIISILKNLGFTKFEKFQGEIYINNKHYRHAMREIKIALMDAGLHLRYSALIDIISLLAFNGANLETGENATIEVIPKRKTPQVSQLRGF